MATVPADMEVEAHFLAKEDGVIAGISLVEMIFNEVDPSLKVVICNWTFIVTVESAYSEFSV